MIRRFLCGMLAAMVLFAGTARAEVQPGEALIRLHVIAQDNTREAQRLKLQVRDAVLQAAQALLAGCENTEEAWARLNAHLDAFEEIAERTAGLEVTAMTGVYRFPDRVYAGATVPGGEYRALRVVIGEGEGRNWWCVLYPSLCLASEEGYYSIFGRWLERLFGGEGT